MIVKTDDGGAAPRVCTCSCEKGFSEDGQGKVKSFNLRGRRWDSGRGPGASPSFPTIHKKHLIKRFLTYFTNDPENEVLFLLEDFLWRSHLFISFSHLDPSSLTIISIFYSHYPFWNPLGLGSDPDQESCERSRRSVREISTFSRGKLANVGEHWDWQLSYEMRKGIKEANLKWN